MIQPNSGRTLNVVGVSVVPSIKHKGCMWYWAPPTTYLESGCSDWIYSFMDIQDIFIGYIIDNSEIFFYLLGNDQRNTVSRSLYQYSTL